MYKKRSYEDANRIWNTDWKRTLSSDRFKRSPNTVEKLYDGLGAWSEEALEAVYERVDKPVPSGDNAFDSKGNVRPIGEVYPMREQIVEVHVDYKAKYEREKEKHAHWCQRARATEEALVKERKLVARLRQDLERVHREVTYNSTKGTASAVANAPDPKPELSFYFQGDE